MQKVKIFMIAAMIAVSATFIGCEEIPWVSPTIRVILNGTVQTTISVPADQEVVMDIDWQAGLGFNLKEVRLSVVGGANVAGFPKTSGFTSNSLEKLEGHVVRSPHSTQGGEVRFFTEVTTSGSGEPVNREIVITFTALPNPVDRYQSVELSCGILTSTNNICFASSNGQRFGISPVNPAIIDFVYFVDLTGPTLCSPNTAGGSGGAMAALIGGWSTRNATKIARLTNVTAAQFDAVTNEAHINQHVSASLSGEFATNLVAGHVVGFVTVGGKRGMIKVNSVGTNNTINIEVKVQR